MATADGEGTRPRGIAHAGFGNCRITLQAHVIEDKKGDERHNIQLTFPVEIQAEKLIAQLGKQMRWAKRFQSFGKGDDERFFYWLRSFEQKKDRPRPLEEVTQGFTFGSVDFGLHADSWAMHEARLDGKFGTDKKGRPVPSRAITTSDEAPWRLVTRELRKLRLPGSDPIVWRRRGKKEMDDREEFAWREELYGDRGRSASATETAQCFRILCDLLGDAYAWEFVSHEQKMPGDDTKAAAMLAESSFPEQNDKLIVAARRAQSRLARIARWRAGIAEESRRDDILKELRDASGLDEMGERVKDEKNGKLYEAEHWIPAPIRDAAKIGNFDALKQETRAEHARPIVSGSTDYRVARQSCSR